MGKEDVIILNNAFEQRTSQSGKVRYTIKVRSEPVIVNLDPKSLGAPIAAAIAHHLREKIKGITVSAAAATLKARAVERKAYAAGKAWAVKRFSGGRIGETPPLPSDRALNSSGRFADSIKASASKDGAWRVNVAANRLNAATGNITRIIARVAELVPEIQNPALLLENGVLKKAIEKARDGMVKKQPMTAAPLFLDRVVGILKAGAEFYQEVNDLVG